MSGTDLGAVADELYARLPEEFTAARDEFAARARREHDPELSRAVKTLRKPTTAAWLANHLVHRDRAQMQQLVELGCGLREAEQVLDGEALRQLLTRRRQLLAALASSPARDRSCRKPQGLPPVLPLTGQDRFPRTRPALPHPCGVPPPGPAPSPRRRDRAPRPPAAQRVRASAWCQRRGGIRTGSWQRHPDRMDGLAGRSSSRYRWSWSGLGGHGGRGGSSSSGYGRGPGAEGAKVRRTAADPVADRPAPGRSRRQR